MGLCPDLSDSGWCDCGSAGDYPILAESNVCGYTSLDPSATIALSTTDCASTTTTIVLPVIVTVTAAPVLASSGRAAKREVPSLRGPAARKYLNRFNKRTGQVNFADSCNAAPPAGSGYKSGNGFPTMTSVLQQAYNDAVSLATAVQNVAADNKGFTHYFGGDLPDKQLTHFQNMMKAIASSDNHYAINFECKNVPTCGDDSNMVTTSDPGSATDVKLIQVCSKFWTGASTKFLLYDPTKTSPSLPYRNNDASGWCGKKKLNDDPNVSSQRHQFFATAGHTVLHELTHLDALAQVAGLAADELNRHGTTDAQVDCELEGARGFLANYIAKKTKETSPDYNAESYAAAATEIYFMSLCQFSEIIPIAAS